MKLQTPTAVASGASVDSGAFTGEQSLVEQFAGKILTCWHKSTAGFLELARACADADSKLPPPAKKALIDKLPFDRSTFAKLVGVGNDQRLVRVSAQLPQKFSVLYEVSKFDNTLFETAVKNGAIHPKVTREEILLLAGKPKDKSTKSKLAGLQKLWQAATDSDRQQFKEWSASN
jgi:hypothetical protein